jgi:CBS domain containing-hemolysin-like protein
MTGLFLVIALSLGVSFVCSVLEAVLLSLTHSFVAILQKQHPRVGRLLGDLRAHIEEPIAAILTLNTIAHTVGAAVGGAMALQVFGSRWIAIFSALLTLAILVLSEIIPKTIGATHWQRLAVPSAYVLKWMVLLMKPILIPLGLVTRLITPKGQKPVTVSRAEFEVLAEISRREGELDIEEWRVVSSVINLDQIHVRRVMTPRTEIIAISENSDVRQAKEAMLKSGHLRLPVFSGSIDHIAGIVVARDVWNAESKGIAEISTLMRPPLFVPETQDVESLIRTMRLRQIKMAVVLDEFGGTAGIVTLEDLIEEIVGEIQDEHELEPDQFVELPSGDIIIMGDTPIEDVNERLDLKLNDDEYDTIGGLVFGLLGHLPETGEQIDLPEGTLFIEESERRRVVRLRFRRHPK